MLSTKFKVIKSFHKVKRLEQTVKRFNESLLKEKALNRISAKGTGKDPKDPNTDKRVLSLVKIEPVNINSKILDLRTTNIHHKMPVKRGSTGLSFRTPLMMSDYRLLNEVYRSLYYLKVFCTYESSVRAREQRVLYHDLNRYYSMNKFYSSSQVVSRFLSTCGNDVRLSRKAHTGHPKAHV